MYRLPNYVSQILASPLHSDCPGKSIENMHKSSESPQGGSYSRPRVHLLRVYNFVSLSRGVFSIGADSEEVLVEPHMKGAGSSYLAVGGEESQSSNFHIGLPFQQSADCEKLQPANYVMDWLFPR